MAGVPKFGPKITAFRVHILPHCSGFPFKYSITICIFPTATGLNNAQVKRHNEFGDGGTPALVRQEEDMHSAIVSDV